MRRLKLSKTQQETIARIRASGGTITFDADGYVDAAGKSVHQGTIRALCRLGLMTSNNDAMFDAKPQSYRLCQQNG